MVESLLCVMSTVFENGGIRLANRLHWDVLNQWQNIQIALRKSHAEYGNRIASVGVDTWGVDFGLLDRNDELLGNPYHYRDNHLNGILEKAFEVVPRDEIFAETGLQFMQINSLYQLFALKQANSAILESAECLLMIGDLFHWMLTGEKANEQTNASTTQFYNPVTADWSKSLLQRFGLNPDILQSITAPGTQLGTLQKSVKEETNLGDVPVIFAWYARYRQRGDGSSFDIRPRRS